MVILHAAKSAVYTDLPHFFVPFAMLGHRGGSVRTGGSEEIERGAALSTPTMAGSGGEEDLVGDGTRDAELDCASWVRGFNSP